MNLALLFLCIGLAWFDSRTRRIPNTVTLPILITGLVLNLPGTPETWLFSTLLFTGWTLGWIGGGDAKLWLAVLWILPPGGGLALLAAAVWIGTGLIQLVLRWSGGVHTFRAARPAAWRTIPFVLLLSFIY